MAKSWQKDLSDKSEEQVKFELNEIMMKAKGTILFSVMDNEAVEFATALRKLTYFERMGFYQYVLQKINEIIASEKAPTHDL